MGIPSTGPVLTSAEFPNDQLAGAGESITVSLEGYTHARDYAPGTGVFAELSDLLRDGPLMNAPALTTLTIAGLLPGQYEITTYHHTTQFGPSERPGTPFSVTLTDAARSDAVVGEDLLMSDNNSPELQLLTFEALSDGAAPLVIRFEKSAGTDHFALPGLEISLLAAEEDPNIIAPESLRVEAPGAGTVSIPLRNLGATKPLQIND
ncbi:MAG: hypothetical protein GWO24_26565, partial [Akkermansiaceae bacterium]|nr:hypothetical protein [Akkermansiaceae bacterium]